MQDINPEQGLLTGGSCGKQQEVVSVWNLKQYKVDMRCIHMLLSPVYTETFLYSDISKITSVLAVFTWKYSVLAWKQQRCYLGSVIKMAT